MYSPLSRRSTARGSITGLVPVGLNKVKARKSVLFTEGTPEVEKIFIFSYGKYWTLSIYYLTIS